jgi:hypothetical protein
VNRVVKGAALALLLAVAAALAVAAHSALAPSSSRSDAWAQARSQARQADRTEAVIRALGLRGRALEQLDVLTRVGPASERSHAAMLAGLLDLENAGQDRGNRKVHLEAAATAFQRAVRLDPANDDAAYDLELLLSRSKADGRPVGEGQRKEKQKTSTGRATARSAGSGY